MNIKQSILLIIAHCTIVSSHATQIWLENDSQKSIIYECNNQNPVTLAHGNRVNVGSLDNLKLAIRTNIWGSKFRDLADKIKEIATTLQNSSHKQIEQEDAVIIILPSPLMSSTWNLKINWEEASWRPSTQIWEATGSNTVKWKPTGEVYDITNIVTSLRNSTTPEQFIALIINKGILGPDYIQKTDLVNRTYAGHYLRQEVTKAKRIMPPLSTESFARCLEIINQLKKFIDENYGYVSK